MSRATGIDLVISGRDETGPIFGQFARSLQQAENVVANTGKRISNDFVGKVGGALAGFMGVQAIDRALREFHEKLTAGADATDAGLAAATSFAEGLQQFPIAGVIGQWLAEGVDSGSGVGGWIREGVENVVAMVIGPAAQIAGRHLGEAIDEVIGDGGNLAAERAQQESRKLAERLNKTQEQVSEFARRLRSDMLSEEQRRLQEFEQQIAPMLRSFGHDGNARSAARERLEEEFQAREERLRQQEREKQAAEQQRAVEQRRAEEQREQEQAARAAAQAEAEAESARLRRLEELRRAEERLSGAVERGSVSERALSFQNERREAVSGPSSSVMNAFSPQAMQLQAQRLEQERLQRDQLATLRLIANRFPRTESASY